MPEGNRGVAACAMEVLFPAQDVLGVAQVYLGGRSAQISQVDGLEDDLSGLGLKAGEFVVGTHRWIGEEVSLWRCRPQNEYLGFSGVRYQADPAEIDSRTN